MKANRLQIWSSIAEALLAVMLSFGVASCKPTENSPAPETQETTPGDANAAKVVKDYGPTLLKIATQYWIHNGENYNSLLYASHQGFIDLNGKVVIEPTWEDVRDFSEGIAKVKGGGKWSWIDKAGRVFECPASVTFNKEAMPANFNMPNFYEGLAAFGRDGKWGFMDTKGTVVVKPEWDEVGNFDGGYAGVRRGGKWGGIDKTGRLVTPLGRCEQLEFQSQLRLWLIKREGKWGFVDMSGRVVVKPGWDDGGAYFSEGLSVATRDGMCGFIDKTGKVVIPFEWEYAQPFSEGLAPVQRNEKWGFIDKTGKFVIEPRWDLAMNFREGLATVKQDGKWGAIDKTGKVVIEPQWNNSLPLTFCQGLACIQRDKKYGFIDRTGRIVIEPQWDAADSYQETANENAPVYWLVAREEKKPEPSPGGTAEDQPAHWFFKQQSEPPVRVEWLDSTGKQIWSSDNSNSSTNKDTIKSPPPSVSPGPADQPNHSASLPPPATLPPHPQ
jgi:hypothetical protein